MSVNVTRETRQTATNLMRERRFAPFFWVQFAGALNDNLFKVGFTSVVTYQSVLFGVADGHNAAFLIAAVFMLPFLLFSASAGQLADKYDKAALIRGVKTLEIVIMILASVGFLIHDARILYLGIFLLGTHSSVFGPAKYAYLPEQLRDDELVRGNGLVEMGTFVSILLGTVIGGSIASFGAGGGVFVAVLCLSVALFGRVMAAWIPSRAPAAPDLKLNLNPFSETWRNLVLAYETRAVFFGLIGISWLWFVGAVFLTSFFSFAHDMLSAGPTVVTLLLAVFTIGVGLGSLACGRVHSGHALGWVPLGGIGMTVFSIDLFLACQSLPPALSEPEAMYTVAAFLQVGCHWRILFDLFLLALSGGLYSVPLYALIQMRSAATHRARIIAANNILNSLFMVVSSVLAVAVGKFGGTIAHLYLIVGILNVAIMVWLCLKLPELTAETRRLFNTLVHSRAKR